MTRKCPQCKEALILNEKLGLMECVSGLHYALINTVRAQWWNSCPKCGQTGVNDRDSERYHQSFKDNKPVTVKVGDKKHVIVFDENPSQKPVECKACGNVFTKKGAFN